MTIKLKLLNEYNKLTFKDLVKGIRNVHFTKIFLSPKLKTSNDNDKSYRQRKHHSIPSELFDDDENIIIQQLTVFL